MPNTQNTEQILVAGPAWVGDMVMAQSLFKTLKQRPHPVEIDVLAPAWSNPILKRMPEVRDVINLPVSHGELGFITRYKIGKSLRYKKYDQAIITPRSYKSALIPFFASAKKRTGYRGEMRYGVINDIHPLDKNILKQTVQRYVALGLSKTIGQPPETPYPSLTVDKENLNKVMKRLSLNTDKPVIALLPGAEYGEAKRWPIAYYSSLAEKIIAEGYQVWVLGSEKDNLKAKQIIKSENIINLCGQTTLEDSIDLLSVCACAVTNDSGLMHIAAAVDIPLIAIYGSSTPEYTPPMSNKAIIEYIKLECSPCFERQCPLKHTNCLKNIKPEMIMKHIGKVLD